MTFDNDMQDINGGALTEALPNPLAKETANYVVEYGIRPDDGALVFHFFPARGEDWDLGYQMNKRLERALHEVFGRKAARADFVDELRSFCVIVWGMASVPDPMSAAATFFDSIDAALEASS